MEHDTNYKSGTAVRSAYYVGAENPHVLPGYVFDPNSFLTAILDIELVNDGDDIVALWNGHSYRALDLPDLQLVAHYSIDADLVTAAARSGWNIRTTLRVMCAICGNDESSGVYESGDVLCQVCRDMPQSQRIAEVERQRRAAKDYKAEGRS